MSTVTWTFWDYVDSSGQNAIEDWLNTFRQRTRIKITSKLVAIFERANAEGRLTYPRYETLKPPHNDLIVVRFERDKTQYRVFACYGNQGRGEIWLLAGGQEQNDQYRPQGIRDTAIEHRTRILNRTSQVRPTCLLENNN